MNYPKSEIPKQIFKDGMKWLMVPSRIFLEGLSMWPAEKSWLADKVSILCLVSSILIFLGQLLFVTDKDINMASATYGLSLIVASFEIMSKRGLCYIHKKKIAKVVAELYYEFWPSDLVGLQTHKELTRTSKYLILFCGTYTCFAFLRAVEGIISSYLNKDLPLCTMYPFKWKESPYYEMLYVWESFMIVEMAFNIGCFDIFFLSILLNCGTQFKLLKIFIEQHGSAESFTKNLKAIVVRHNKLISVCKEVDSIFAIFILIQYLMSMAAVCLSSFISVAAPDGLRGSLPFALGHTLEIFIYCVMGEYIAYESSQLSVTVFQCNWHLWDEDESLKKHIILILSRCQKAIHVSIGGFGHLNFASFMKLLQFSFSVFTVLNKIMIKNV